MKLAFRFVLGLAILVVAAFFLLRTPDTDKAEMIAKYGSEASRFVADGAGGEIHYRDEGNRDGSAIVLIHGSNSHLQTWEDLVRLLGDRFRLISLDLPGHGLTGPSGHGEYGADANIASVVRILDEAGVDKAYWVGNSMGGWVSWRAGLSVPERVSGLVLIDASGAQTGEKIKPYLGARLAQSTIGQWLLPQITPKFLVRSSLEENYAQPERLSDEIVTRYHDMLHFPGNRQAALERGNAPRQPEMWNQVGSLDMPVLLLWGAQDKVIPVSHGEAFEEAIPGAELVIYDDAGHLPMEETPEQVARDIRTWIDKIEAPAEPELIDTEAG
ncbi:MAG: alpha/beta hydrolase [Pseudomonadota bacterium]